MLHNVIPGTYFKRRNIWCEKETEKSRKSEDGSGLSVDIEYSEILPSDAVSLFV